MALASLAVRILILLLPPEPSSIRSRRSPPHPDRARPFWNRAGSSSRSAACLAPWLESALLRAVDRANPDLAPDTPDRSARCGRTPWYSAAVHSEIRLTGWAIWPARMPVVADPADYCW